MANEAAAAAHNEHEHGHDPNLAHHFEAPSQQFYAGKLGIWLFLSTEVLFFGGLFCAYAVYRANHPEIFVYAHKYLDTTLGAINTVFLICSSLTMAWGVRAAQLGQRKVLIGMLAATLAFACCFLGIKAVEYHTKWKEGLLPGASFKPLVAPGEHMHEDGEHGAGEHGDAEHAESQGEHSADAQHAGSATAAEPGGGDSHVEDPAAAAAPGAADLGLNEETPTEPEQSAESAAATPEAEQNAADAANAIEKSNIAPPAAPPPGLARDHAGQARMVDAPHNVHLFFGVYFTMTGLHGVHVVVGMGVIIWLLVRAIRGDFGPNNFAAVDFVGLYWHLVDLVWIYLFPLLYLIH